jgi:hypothetical protein
VQISLSISDGGALQALNAQIDAISQPFGGSRGDAVLAAVRKAIAEEFSRGAERTDSGFKKWAKSHDFGTRKAAVTPLGGGRGRYARAWAGGEGGSARVNAGREIIISVRLPGAAMHRGDLGDVVTIKPKRQGDAGRSPMFWALGLGFGVWITPSRLRQGLKVPARPHARATASLGKIVQAAWLGIK